MCEYVVGLELKIFDYFHSNQYSSVIYSPCEFIALFFEILVELNFFFSVLHREHGTRSIHACNRNIKCYIYVYIIETIGDAKGH